MTKRKTVHFFNERSNRVVFSFAGNFYRIFLLYVPHTAFVIPLLLQPIYRSYRASVLSCAQTQKYMMPSAAYSSSRDLISRAGWMDISGDNGGIPASRCGRVIGETNSNAAVSRKCSSFMAGSSSMAGSDSGGLDGCKVYSGVPQYGSRLSLEAFPGYCREAVGLSGTRIRTEHYGNILILPD